MGPEDLARRAIDGDPDALDAVARQLQGDIYGLALRMLWNKEDAEDATQEILVRVVTRLSQFDFRSRLKTWVYRVAVNHILDIKKSAIERLHLSFEQDCRYVWTYQNAASAPPFLYNPDGSLSDIPFGGGAAADAAAETPARGTADAGGRGGAPGGRGPGSGRGPIPPNERIRYNVVNCHLGKNLHLAGSGTGATLGCVPIDADFLNMVGSRITNQPVPIEMNQRSRTYLHPVAGSDAAMIGAGLFAKPVA